MYLIRNFWQMALEPYIYQFRGKIGWVCYRKYHKICKEIFVWSWIYQLNAKQCYLYPIHNTIVSKMWICFIFYTFFFFFIFTLEIPWTPLLRTTFGHNFFKLTIKLFRLRNNLTSSKDKSLKHIITILLN